MGMSMDLWDRVCVMVPEHTEARNPASAHETTPKQSGSLLSSPWGLKLGTPWGLPGDTHS